MLSIGTLYLLKFYTDELGMLLTMAGLSFWWRNFLPHLPIAHRIFTRLAEKYWT